MRILELPEIRRVLVYREIFDLMRQALIAQARGECETPMPMHLDIAKEQAEVHMKSSYRRGGRHFALKMASTFPTNSISRTYSMLPITNMSSTSMCLASTTIIPRSVWIWVIF